jgi:hypothetical protein
VIHVNQAWPVAELDSVRQLRIMSVALKGATFAEAFVDCAPERVWAVIGDIEGELPHLLPDIKSTRLRQASDGRHLEALAYGYLGQRARFDVDLAPGWCWMQSRLLLCGFAATAERSGTRYAFLGGVRAPGMKAVSPLLRRPAHAYGRVVTDRIRRRVELAAKAGR